VQTIITENMADSWSSKVAWEQIQSAFGDSRVVRELLQEVLAGEDVWGDLFGQVLHQGTIYEATVVVAAWMVEALQGGRLGERLIPLHNPSTGEKIMVSERALVFGLLSGMAQSAHEALNSGRTRKRYASIAALVLEALRPGIPLYEAGVENLDDEMSKASSTLLAALAAGGTTEAIDSQDLRSLKAKLGMPSRHPPPEE
jgi:hypothetical protein